MAKACCTQRNQPYERVFIFENKVGEAAVIKQPNNVALSVASQNENKTARGCYVKARLVQKKRVQFLSKTPPRVCIKTDTLVLNLHGGLCTCDSAGKIRRL